MQRTNKTKQFTRGGQITFHNLRMLFQINKIVGKVYIFSILFLTVALVWLITPVEILVSTYYFCYAKINPLLELFQHKTPVFIVPYHGSIYRISPNVFLNEPHLIANAHSIWHYLLVAFAIAFILSIGIAFYLIKWLTSQGEKQTEDRYVRGSRLDSVKNVARMIKKDCLASDIVIDDMPLILDTETQHILSHGTTGTGKTQLIMKLLDALRKRGDKVILYDKGCTYTTCFYRAGIDKILNPYDTRCENWDLWQEALEAPDFENMAESLIPMHGDTDPFWVNAARTIFGSAAFTMQDDQDRSVDKLLKLLLTSELKELEKYLVGTEAATLTSDKIEKTAISIRSVITTFLKSLRFLQGLDVPEKPKFSIRDWIGKKDDNNSWLFLSSNAEQHSALKPLISMWFAMASITMLSLPENRNRRIWFICDELPSLHKLPQLPETIAEARKFGGCFVLGMQSYAQLEKVYGRNAGREIFDLLNTRFFFRSPSADLAKLVSYELGEQEVEDMRENYSYGANTIRDGVSIGAQQMTKPIVVYPEIMELKDMCCYLRLPAQYPVTLLELNFQARKKNEAGFIKRDFKPNPEIEESIKMAEGKAIKAKVEKAKRVEAEAESDVKDKSLTKQKDQAQQEPDDKGKGKGQKTLNSEI
jgi:type IV conjugative transfer system coupling protein TraD